MMTVRSTVCIVVLASAGAVACLVGGCEEKAPPPAAPSGGATPQAGVVSGQGNGALNNMRNNPTSLLGRSAQQGKNTGAAIEQDQARASGLADEISGNATAVEVAGLSFSAPSEWERNTSPSSMRVAEFKVPSETGGDGATVVWFYFPGSGGNVAQNLERWKTMVTGTDVQWRINKRTIGGMQVTLADAEGTYQDGMPGGAKTPRSGYAFRGAIIEGKQGNVFIRMTGPVAVVEGAASQWKSVIDGVRQGQK